MVGRRLSEAERAEVWGRWKRGEAQRAIAKALGVTHPTVHKL